MVEPWYGVLLSDTQWKSKKANPLPAAESVSAEAGYDCDSRSLTLYLRLVVPVGELYAVHADDVADGGGPRALQNILCKVDDTAWGCCGGMLQAVPTLMNRLARTGCDVVASMRVRRTMVSVPLVGRGGENSATMAHMLSS